MNVNINVNNNSHIEINSLPNDNNSSNQSKIIQSITHCFEITNLHEEGFTSLLGLTDSKLVTGSKYCLSLWEINYTTKQCTNLHNNTKAHDDWINYISKLNESKIISCSADKTIKIWNISISNKLSSETIFSFHTDWVFQVIPLTNNRIASLSLDKTIKLYNIVDYKPISIPFEKQQHFISCLFQLQKQKEVLSFSLIGNNENENTLMFYSLIQPYKLIGKIDGVCTGSMLGMVELESGFLALIRKLPSPKRIIIVDPFKFLIVNEIIDSEYMFQEGTGTLCALRENSFIYVHCGCVCQVMYAEGEYKIVFKTKKDKDELFGGGGIMMVDKNDLFISRTSNGNKGVNIYKMIY